MRSYIVILITFTLFCFNNSYAQSCANNWEWPSNKSWYFGNGKLSQFGNNGLNVYQTHGGGYHNSYEGVATVVDDNGVLQFFTNGIKLWDAVGNVIYDQLTTGSECAGYNGSAVQGILIVKHPLDEENYYIFCGDDVIGDCKSGLDVFQFNIKTKTVTPAGTISGAKTTEGLTATLHQNGTDIWITSQQYNSTTMNNFLLCCNGLKTSAVKSNVGVKSATDPKNRGALEYNHQGTKLASVHPENYPNGDKEITIFDFDKGTGKLSNPVHLSSVVDNLNPYDCEFSPNGSKLYVGTQDGKIYVFDLSLGSNAAITASRKLLKSGLGAHTRIEMGFDGNIYANSLNGNNLHRISGNLDGMNAKVNSTNIGGLSAHSGLPNTYIPLKMQPRIEQVGPFSKCDAAVDLNTTYECYNTNAEDCGGCEPSKYTGPGITNECTGIFDPCVAGAGTHMIIFQKCSMKDTTYITVTDPSGTKAVIDPVAPLCETDGSVALSATPPGGTFTINGVEVTSFDPAVHLEGLHEVIYNPPSGCVSSCASGGATSDTIEVEVKKCIVNCLDTTISQLPVFCTGLGSVDLSNHQVTVDPGVWTLVSVPSGGNTSVLSGNLFDATSAIPGNYLLRFTLDGGPYDGCPDSAERTVIVYPKPAVDLGNDTTICPESPGVTFDAGAGSTTYAWSINGSGAAQTFGNTTTAGDYAVEVTDANGCKDSDTVALAIFTSPVVDLGNDTSVCPGESVTFDAGTFTSYAWSLNGTGAAQTTPGSTAGNYAVIVTDANGCTDSDTVALSIYVKPVVDLGTDQTVCPGDSFTFDATSFSSYAWSGNGSGTDSVFHAKVAGDYIVDVTDANGCKDTDTVALAIHTAPVVNLGNDVSVCPGDSNEFDAGNFAAYEWSINGSGTAQTFMAKVVGDYAVIVTDANGCKDSDTVALTLLASPIADLGKDTSICPGDDYTFDAGNFAAYEWSINGSGTAQTFTGSVVGNYAVVVTDANGCKDSDTVALNIYNKPVVDLGQDRFICPGDPAVEFDAGSFSSYQWSLSASGTAQTYTSSTAGNFAVVVTDANNCKDSDTVSLSIYAKPVVDLGADRIICAGAANEVFDAGNFTSYQWEMDASGTTKDYSTNTAGNFAVIVTDANGCKDSDTVALQVIPLPTPDVIADVSICPGMNQTFEVNTYDNGNGAFTYSWQDGSTASNINVGTQGWYWVDITDRYGCVGRDSAYLTIKQNLDVTIFSAPEIQLCAGEDTILRTNYNAVDGYNFTWSGLGSGTTETITTSQTSGTYEVRVDNGQGCEGTAQIDIVINPLPTPVPYDTNYCEGSSVNIGLGMGGAYSYAWNNGETTEFITVNSGNLASPYNIVVTNIATGCTATATINVTEHLNPVVNVEDVTVCDGVPVTLQSTNNHVNSTFSWTGGSTDPSLSPTVGGSYTLTVTSDKGCVGSDAATVVFNPIPLVDLGPDTVTICEGESHTFDAGNAGKDILWNNAATTSTVTGTASFNYIVTVTDAGCSARDTAQLIVVPLPTSEIDQSLAVQKYCFEDMDRGVTLLANASDQYNYQWSTGETDNSITVFSKGTYSVSIQSGGCKVEDEITLKEYCPWGLYVPNAITLNEDGLNDVFNAKGHNIIDYEMYIYNRWGEQIFKTNSLSEGWDGKVNGNDVQIDVYVYLIKFSHEDEQGAVIWEDRVGTVTVVR